MKDLILSDELPDLVSESYILVVSGIGNAPGSITEMLQNHGAVHIKDASNNYEAMDILEEYTTDLILLYINSENMNWLEFCTLLRKGNEKSRIIPIIAITDMDKKDDRVKILKFNVTGVLHLPVNNDELYKALNFYLQKSRLIKRLEDSISPTSDDLEVARRMQYTLLPDDDLIKACANNYGVAIHHLYKSSQALGGDYWTIKQLENSKLMICIADFAGHGVSVAIDTFRLHNYLAEYANYSDPPSKILEDMNNNFYRMLPTGQYLTCFLGIIDTANNILSYAGAGAPPAIIINDRESIELNCSGTPIGAYPKAEYLDKKIDLGEGWILVAYSDALVEINQDDKYIFNNSSLQEYLQEWSSGGMENIYQNILKRIKLTGHHFDDDLTLVILAQSY